MILQLVIWLLAVAGASMLITHGRRRRIWSVLILLSLVIFSIFLSYQVDTQHHQFIHPWLSYDNLKAQFNISADISLQYLFTHLFVLLLGLIYLNTISFDEKHSLNFNTVLLLGFSCLAFAASSQDFVQLIFSSSMLSILCFYIPDIDSPKKKLFSVLFFAEMSMFIAFCIIYGQTENIGFAKIINYNIEGKHKDLVTTLLLFSVGCKMGLFLLNSQYFNLKDIKSTRLIGVVSVFMPLSGLITIEKLFFLLSSPSIPKEVFIYWCQISMISSLLVIIINNNIKTKGIAFGLLGNAFCAMLVFDNGKSLYNQVFFVLLVSVIFFMIVYIAVRAASEEANASYLGGFWRITKQNCATALILCASILFMLPQFGCDIKSYFYSISCLLSLASLIKLIYFGKPRSNEKIISFAVNAPYSYQIPLLALGVFLFWYNNQYSLLLPYIYTLSFAVIVILFPSDYFIRFGNLSIWQSGLLNNTYEVLLIRPLKVIARFLWLVFDVVVIERNVIATLSHSTKALVLGIRKTQENEYLGYIIYIILGFALIFAYWGAYFYG